MTFWYGIEETLPSGETVVVLLAPLGLTWLQVVARALELMKESGWTREMRAVCTSISEGD